MLENPNRPGPYYYKDCIKFNWVTALIKNHKSYITDKGGDYEYLTLTEEDLKWQAKLKEINFATYYRIGVLSATGATLVSLI